jgi:hypothetical protein
VLPAVLQNRGSNAALSKHKYLFFLHVYSEYLTVFLWCAVINTPADK